MTITLYMPPAAGLFDSSGDPLSGGLVNTYVSGTTTAKNSYPTQDDAAAQTNANANPVVLDSNGRAQIWLDGVYKVVVTDSAGSTIQTVDEYGLVTDADVYDKEYLQGLEVTLDTDTAHDVNVTAGEARDVSDTSDIVLTGEITKRVDATWAVGDDNGGLDTSTVAATSIYYIWLIQRSDTGVEDVLISLSASAPTMPTSYDKKRLIGVGKTDGSSNWTFVSKAGWTDYHNCIFPDSATTDAYAVAPQPVHAQYFTGMRVRFRAATLNTAASTLNLNGLGAKALEYNGDAVVTGDIIANQIVEAEYDGTAFQMLTPPNILDVAQGGSGVASLTDGGVLLGSGTGDITAFGVLADSNFLVGDGTTDPVAETGDTARISLGVGTSDSPTFTGLTTTGHTQRSLETGITAGTTQTMAGATALTKDINIVTINGNDDDGVALPTAVAGKEVMIINSDAAQRLQVWPGNGFSDTIDGGSANAVDPNKLAAGDVRTYAADGSTNWVTSAVNVSAASATASGIVELATTAETTTGTDTARAVTPDGLHDMTSLSGAVWMLDEDNMATDSNTKVASQQSIKAYVDGSGGGAPGRNYLANPNMMYDQRVIDRSGNETILVAAGASVYTLDRWVVESTSTAAFSVSSDTSSVPAGVSHSMKVDITTADGTIASGEHYFVEQRIEGLYCGEFSLGLSGAATVSISFWARSQVTGIHCVSLSNSAENRSYVFEYTIASGDTWEYFTKSFTLDTTGTWLLTTGIGLRVRWSMGAGSNFHGTADSWEAANDTATSNQVNAVASTGQFGIAAAKLEIGSSATAFRYTPAEAVADEELCFAYFERFRSTSAVNPYIAAASSYDTTLTRATLNFRTKRVIPTITDSAASDFRFETAGTGHIPTSVTFTEIQRYVCLWNINDTGSNFTAGEAGNVYMLKGSPENFIDISAEI